MSEHDEPQSQQVELKSAKETAGDRAATIVITSMAVSIGILLIGFALRLVGVVG
jgi:hypothetical protein